LVASIRSLLTLSGFKTRPTTLLNGYVNRIVSEASSGTSWGGTKYRLVAPAGHVLDRVGALKIVRRALTGNDK
jgi:hypothetical protein